MITQTADPKSAGILYVDDEEQALKYFRRGFEKEYPIFAAPNVDQALTILEQNGGSIGVVITDQRMPGRSGVELLTEIRNRWPSIVRILITAYTDLDSAVAAVNSGAVFKYLTKPADFAVMRQALKEAMSAHRETVHRDALAETLKQLELQRQATQAAEADKEQLHQRLVTASRAAGRAEVATGILHNVGNVLNSMNVSAAVVNNTIRESRLDNLIKCLAMLEEHSVDMAEFITADQRGQRLPNYLVKLGPVLQAEHNSIVEAMSVLNRSIEHIMQVVRVQQSDAKQIILPQSVSPAALMEDAIRVSQSAIESRGIKIVRDFGEPGDIVADQHRVLQILINLVSNGVQSLSTSPTVEKSLTLRIAKTNDSVPPQCRFQISDTGIGIAPENLTRIFTFGFTTKAEGHGFGLHSAANAAREMGGELIVSSAGLGHGATFTLQLPISGKCSEPSEPKLNVEGLS